jgi:hypothetical protein
MKREIFIKEYQRNFFQKINNEDFTKDKQIHRFFTWCYIKGFLDNLTEDDLNWFFAEDGISLPLLKQHGITIGVESWTDYYFRVGIDPSPAFNKTTQCSILVKFPISSAREETQFYVLLNALVEKKKKKYVQEWYKNAGTMFYGEYFSNCR